MDYLFHIYMLVKLVFLPFIGYLELGTGVFIGGQNFDISMDFRTDQLNALLLFTYNTRAQDYMLVRADVYLK